MLIWLACFFLQVGIAALIAEWGGNAVRRTYRQAKDREQDHLVEKLMNSPNNRAFRMSM
jgi:hypothetical protein